MLLLQENDGVNIEAALAAGVDAEQAQKDKALAILAHNDIDFDMESDEAKRVLRKIDKRIMPIIWILYLLQLMDKNSLRCAVYCSEGLAHRH